MVKPISCQIVLTLLVIILISSHMTISLRRIEKLAALALIANAGGFGGGPKIIPVPVYVGGDKGGKNHHHHHPPQQKVLQPIIITGCGAGPVGHDKYPVLGLGGGAIGGAHGVW